MKSNLIKTAPYSDQGIGKRKLVDDKHLLMMQVALKPGQEVPEYSANSNVYLIVITGEINLIRNDNEVSLSQGELIPINFETKMKITNTSKEPATFVVIKTPHPNHK